MAPRTQKNRKKRISKKKKKEQAKKNLSALSVQDLILQAQEHIDSFEYEEAQKCCQAALTKDADNIAVLEISASLCLETGNHDGARQCLGRAITVQPEEGHGKFLSMAQLLQGKEALQCYLKGIEIIQKKVGVFGEDKDASKANGTENGAVEIYGEMEGASAERVDHDVKGLRKEMSVAHCSVAELFMTDLCDEDDAEKQCRAHVDQAVQVDETNPEGHQARANFLLVKGENEEALQALKKGLDLWWPHLRAVARGEAEPGTFDPVQVCSLSYPARLTGAKLLIELQQLSEAVEILEVLLQEADEEVETWYLLGWAHYLQGKEQADAARYYLRKALKVSSSSVCDEDQVTHINELLQELGASPEQLQVEEIGEEEEREAMEELRKLEEQNSDEDEMDES